MKLLFIVNDPVFFLSHRLPIARAARKSGFDIHVATPSENSVDGIKRENFFFHPIPLVKHGTSVVGEIRTFYSIYRLLLRLKPDIVHLVTIKPVLYGGVAARLAGTPSVVSAVTGMGLLFVSSSWRNKILKLIAKQAYRLAFGHNNQTVVFQNSDDRHFCVSNNLVADKKTIIIKGSGVDMVQFSPAPSLEGVPVVLLAGRLLWEKGVGDFVAAGRLLKERGLSVRFVLAGRSVSWNTSSVSEKQLKIWHQEGIVEWWGEQRDMPGVFNQAEIACLPSKYGEGVPKFLIEAAACGKPVVTTDSPGCREIVRHGVNGLLVPVGDVEALAGALESLLRDERLRLGMGRRGRVIASEEFSQELVIKQTLASYNCLLSNL